MSLPSEWFCALLDSATDVYFRYSVEPGRRRLVYVSPSVHGLTGRTPDDFYRDPGLCLAIVAGQDRRLLRQIRSRRGSTLMLHVVRDELLIPVELRTVALVRNRRVVAIEGVARLVVGARTMRAGEPLIGAADAAEPVQQRLASLMFEVHNLLHRVLPAATGGARDEQSRLLRLGDLALDLDRLCVTESGRAVDLTAREVMVLRYVLERPGRIVTRQQLLADVWAYSYTGDDRTVDVHISRLRRKLPSLRGRLVAIRNIGYRLDEEEQVKAVVNG